MHKFIMQSYEYKKILLLKFYNILLYTFEVTEATGL